MCDKTTPQDSAAMSPASTGSVAGKPAAFRVDEVRGICDRFGGRVFGVAPLYEEHPTLTETERLAIEWAAVAASELSQVAVYKTLRRLLERTK